MNERIFAGFTTVLVVLTGSVISAQTSSEPFPSPIAASEDVITVGIAEFASLPDVNGEAARVMHFVDEPGTERLFVSDMRGLLYSVSYDGQTVTRYLDLTAEAWGLSVEATGRERGFQSFAFHPEFDHPGSPGFGRFYTYFDTSNTVPTPDFVPGGDDSAQDTVLVEWTAETPGAATYDGSPPRVLIRIEQPFRNHNGGQIGFNPLASPGDADFGLLYVGSADGGSGGDPLDLAQNTGSVFGKILRIDPMGSDSTNRQYGIPPDNPFAGDGDPTTLGEIWALGVRNPQRFSWDPKNGHMFVADIGQGVIEEISLVERGANLGWNDWEGSFRFINRREVSLADPRGESGLIYPVAEYAHANPLLQSRSAVTGVVVYRHTAIPQLENLVLFGDTPSGEIFYIEADQLPGGGQNTIRRVLLDDGGEPKTLLQLVQAKNIEQGKPPAQRADVRFGTGHETQIFVLNKHDGTIRVLVP
jgi:hypothetical protein